MKPYKPTVKYDRDDEYSKGFASLNATVTGKTYLDQESFISLAQPETHNPQIVLYHEQNHSHLNTFTTVGNIQQLLARIKYINNQDNQLQARVNEILNESTKGIRWIHEGCATYYAIKISQICKHHEWEKYRDSHPLYYIDALRPFEDIIEKLDIAEESKFVLAEISTRFVLSPPIYHYFSDLNELHLIDITLFSEDTFLERANKIFDFLSDNNQGQKFANTYNEFIKKTYFKIHGFEWTNDVQARSQKTIEENSTKFAIEELLWLYSYFSNNIPSLEIVNPQDIPKIQKIGEAWQEYFRKNKLYNGEVLKVSFHKTMEIDSNISTKPRPHDQDNMTRVQAVDELNKILHEENTQTFAQVYHQQDEKPLILDSELNNKVRKGETYIRFHKVYVKGLDLYWPDSADYSIVPTSEHLAFLKSIDCANIRLCFMEQDIYNLYNHNDVQLRGFTNLITGLIYPNGVEYLKSFIERWFEHLEGYLYIQIKRTQNNFIIFYCRSKGLQFIAPVNSFSYDAFIKWIKKSSFKGLEENQEIIKTGTGIDTGVVLQGIAFYGFA